MEIKPCVILCTLDLPAEPGGHVTELRPLEPKWVEARYPYSLETLQLSPPLLRGPGGPHIQNGIAVDRGLHRGLSPAETFSVD